MKEKTLDIRLISSSLGLLPVPLFGKMEQSKFIMLNGSRGNFCVDYDEEEVELARDNAWSSNVTHYLHVKQDVLKVYRWDSFQSVNYKIESVESRLDDFYSYLERQKPVNSVSSITFAINIYRKIRTLLRDNSGLESLQSFLYLLACYEAESERSDLNFLDWGLSENSSKISNTINSSDWDSLYEVMAKGMMDLGLILNPMLLLKHASGNLFQEAHFQILFSNTYQMHLHGFLPQAQKPTIKSSQLSTHYTPGPLVRTVVEEVLKSFSVLPKELRILDPSCGSGEFLKEVLKQLSVLGYQGNLEFVGWDISPIAVEITRFNLGHEVKNSNQRIEVNIICQDALSSEATWDDNFNIVLMNPPFISWELMDNNQRDLVSSKLGDFFQKKPNTASVFLLKAMESLCDDGVIGTVLPSSIFDADSYTKLRRYLRESLRIKQITKLGNLSIFSNALVDAAILVAQKSADKGDIPLSIWCDSKISSSSQALRSLRRVRNKDLSLPVIADGYTIYENYNLGHEDAWLPTSYKSWKILEKLDHFPRVKDLFYVRQGVRTGLNSVFLISHDYWKTLSSTEKMYFRPAITNDSIIKGKLNDSTYIFYPYGEALAIQSEQELKQNVPRFYKEKILPNKNKLQNRARRSDRNWWKLSEHRAWQIDFIPKIISTEFGTSGSFAFDSKGKYVVERGHAWFPRYMKKIHRDFDDVGHAYITILFMPIVDELINSISKKIGGGQWYLASKYIDNLPIPNLFTNEYDETVFNELRAIGTLISSGSTIDPKEIENLQNVVFPGHDQIIL